MPRKKLSPGQWHREEGKRSRKAILNRSEYKNHQGQIELGRCLKNGTCVEKDEAGAVDLFRPKLASKEWGNRDLLQRGKGSGKRSCGGGSMSVPLRDGSREKL